MIVFARVIARCALCLALSLIATSRCVAQEGLPSDAPKVLQLLKGVLDATARSLPRAEPDLDETKQGPPYPWSIAPESTRAISYVKNMQSYSDKLDRFADLMGLPRPGVLDWACQQTNINAGLNRNGTLMVFVGERKDGHTPVVVLLPSDDHSRLVEPLRQYKKGLIRGLKIDGDSIRSASRGEYSLFTSTDSRDEAWLTGCRQSAGGLDEVLGDFNEYLFRQDIGFVMTNAGAMDGMAVRLPFPRGNYVTPEILSTIATTVFEFTGLQSLGGGTELSLDEGIRVSTAASIDPNSEVAKWPQTMELDRDTLLANVPEAPAAVVLGVSSCRPWNEWLDATWQDAARRHLDRQDVPPDAISFQPIRGALVMLSAFDDLNPADVVGCFHAQLHVDDAPAYLERLRRFLVTAGADPKSIEPSQLDDRQVYTVKGTFLLGPQGISATALNDRIIIFQGGGPERLRNVLADLEAGKQLVNSARLQSTLRMLQPESQQFALIDLYQSGRLAEQLGADLDDVLGQHVPVADLLEAFHDAPPLGLGHRFQPAWIETNVMAPTDLLTCIRKIAR